MLAGRMLAEQAFGRGSSADFLPAEDAEELELAVGGAAAGDRYEVAQMALLDSER